MWFITMTFLVPVPNFHSLPSLNTRSETRFQQGLVHWFWGLDWRRKGEAPFGPPSVRTPSLSGLAGINGPLWTQHDEGNSKGVGTTGVCKCRFRHSGAALRTHTTKSVSPIVSAGLGTLRDEDPVVPRLG